MLLVLTSNVPTTLLAAYAFTPQLNHVRKYFSLQLLSTVWATFVIKPSFSVTNTKRKKNICTKKLWPAEIDSNFFSAIKFSTSAQFRF